MSDDNFDDSQFDYHIEPDEQSRESGGLFFYGSVHYWEKGDTIESDGANGEQFELTATGDSEDEVREDLYSQLAAAQERYRQKKARENDADA